MTKSSFLPEEIVKAEKPGLFELDSMRSTLLQNYLNGTLILGAFVFFIRLYIAIQVRDYASALAVTILFISLFAITFLHKIQPTIRIVLLSLLFLISGVISLVSGGINANSILYFFVSILVLGVLLQRNWWILGLVIEGLIIASLGILIQINLIKLDSFFNLQNSLLNWFSTLTITLFIAFVSIAPLNQYLINVRKRILGSSNEVEGLKESNEDLSQRILVLETEVDRRRSKMIATRQIARELSQQGSTEKIMREAVELLTSQFGFYYSSIFLVDDKNEYAVLKAASGSEGKLLLSQNHKLRIRDEGIVGYVVAKGEARIALDVVEDTVHYKNLLLPDTKSEMAVPLRIGNKVIGVLDVQSDQEATFSNEDLDILQSIADQLASTIDKTMHITDLLNQISDLQLGFSQFTRGAWRSHLQGSKKQLSYSYLDDHLISDPMPQLIENEILKDGKPLQTDLNSDSTQESVYSAPLKLRDQVLGVVKIRYKGKTIPASFVSLIESSTARLAVALENARLLENIQERAEREHIVGDISSKVRSAKNIDAIMQTTVSELSKTLGINEVSIQLKTSGNDN
jgi:GAF domain-containing protein